MEFADFLNLVPKIAKESLPGEQAHQKMAPPERRGIMAELKLPELNVRKAAVLMLVYPRGSTAHLALIMRNSYNGVHSSQIAFPGGKVEVSDRSHEFTALRETHEEIGVPANQVTVVREFTSIYIPPSNFQVFPFLGFSDSQLAFIPDPSEVAGMVEVPLAQCLDDRSIVDQVRPTSYSTSVAVPTFEFGEHHVWGATAMMLNELKEVIKSAL